MNLNIRSLRKNVYQLDAFLQLTNGDYNVVILTLLTEVWNIKNQININGYNYFYDEGHFNQNAMAMSFMLNKI